jgi:hypothetical protein
VAGGQIYPAFSLSGDYIVQGEFDIGAQHYVCTQKVAVRGPGLRAELCWDTVGNNDVDIHFARLQGATCSTHGWDTSCPVGNTDEDCYYNIGSGCPNGGDPAWGYTSSPNSACSGWGSKRGPLSTCTNPRLDLDNISCVRADPDPTHIGLFCGPENINLDNPNDGDAFAVGVNFYNGTSAHPHVDLYCNGQRVLTTGYNPVSGQTSVPLLSLSGLDSTGDFWNVATVLAHVANGQLTSCDINTIPSHHADPTRDGVVAGGGSAPLCVESTMNGSSPSFSYSSHQFVDPGSQQGLAAGVIPGAPAQWCKH